MDYSRLVNTATLAQLNYLFSTGQARFTDFVFESLKMGKDNVLLNMEPYLSIGDVEFIAINALEWNRIALALELMKKRPGMNKNHLIQSAELSYNDDIIPMIMDIQ